MIDEISTTVVNSDASKPVNGLGGGSEPKANQIANDLERMEYPTTFTISECPSKNKFMDLLMDRTEQRYNMIMNDIGTGTGHDYILLGYRADCFIEDRRYDDVATLNAAKCIPIRLRNLATNEDMLYVSIHHSRTKGQQKEEQRALAAFVEREESSADGFDMVIIGGDANAPPSVVRKWKPANTSILIGEADPVTTQSHKRLDNVIYSDTMPATFRVYRDTPFTHYPIWSRFGDDL